MSAKSEYLLRHGWRLVECKRNGCVSIYRWSNGESTMNQTDAYSTQQEINAVKKRQRVQIAIAVARGIA